jgi:hypothetical protein
MADARFVPRSARSIGKVMGALALVGALAGASAFVVWGCTNTESTNFMEPNRPFADSGSGGTTGTASDAASDGKASDAGAKDAVSHDDAAKADSATDH